MAAPGEQSFCAFEYHTSKSVFTVQRVFRAKYAKTCLQTRPFVRGINNLLKLVVSASRKHPCCHMCCKNLNIVLMCAVSPVVHTSDISSCQKKGGETFYSFPVAVNNSIKVGPLVFLL